MFPSTHPFHHALVREWLTECDKAHTGCQLGSSDSISHDQRPKRVLDIGTGSSDCIKLVYPNDPKVDDFKYVALSYAWGDKTKHERYVSTTKNQQNLRDGVAKGELPLTIQHAIDVTRNMGISYLWIDALCIIQEGPDSDFATESERMEIVFSHAYCVIAASRATGTSDGFLGDRQSHASEPINDFQRDVIDGPLNRRGWVLQERALARRTIFFTARQTYWQCGKGVRCETLTGMENAQAAFLGDPNFPHVAATSSRGAKIELYQSLYSSYSTLEFSRITDRPYGIVGMETRLAKAFDCKAGFGVFERYLHRGILWQRVSDTLQRINFPVGTRIPSWSWMAYEGAIEFLEIPGRSVDWEERDFQSPWASSGTQMSSTGAQHSTHTGASTRIRVVVQEYRRSSSDQDHLIFDSGVQPEQSSACVVIGRQKKDMSGDQRHYVLLVNQVRPSEYERIGVGYLTGSDRFRQPMRASLC